MYIDEVKRNSFYQFPQWLLREPYNQLSHRAMLMYMLIWDRRKLSELNKWYDEDGRVYVYFTNEQFMEALGVKSNKTIVETKKELHKIGLLTEVQQGVNKPNRLYINGSVKNTRQDVQSLHGINTNNINTNISRLIEPDLEAPIMTTTNTLISIAEQEFGRLLSPFEIQDLSETAKETSFELIVEAIKETKFNGKTNIKYLNGILRNWRDDNITTVEQVRAKKEKHTPKPAKSNVPYWSNPDYKPAMKGMTREEFLADEE